MSFPVSTTTNFGPLTTVFTPPDDCSTAYVHAAGEGLYGFWGSSCEIDTKGSVPGSNPAPRATCVPGNHGDYYAGADSAIFTSIPVYSPGLVCPAGWTSACSISRIKGGAPPSTGRFVTPADYYIWNQLREGETATACCPSSYVCDTADFWRCRFYATPGDVLTGITYDKACAPTLTTSAVGSADLVAGAPRLLLVRAASDAPAAGQGPGNGDAGGGGGLPLSTTIAVAVAVPVVVIWSALATFFYLYISRRKKRARLQAAHGNLAGPGVYIPPVTKPELDTINAKTAPPTARHVASTLAPATIKEHEWRGGVGTAAAEVGSGAHAEGMTPELQGNGYIASEVEYNPVLPPEADPTTRAVAELSAKRASEELDTVRTT